jgi:hypothetical protein
MTKTIHIGFTKYDIIEDEVCKIFENDEQIYKTPLLIAARAFLDGIKYATEGKI